MVDGLVFGNFLAGGGKHCSHILADVSEDGLTCGTFRGSKVWRGGICPGTSHQNEILHSLIFHKFLNIPSNI